MLDIVAERLRRWTANPLGSPRVGSNPIDVVRRHHAGANAHHNLFEPEVKRDIDYCSYLFMAIPGPFVLFQLKLSLYI